VTLVTETKAGLHCARGGFHVDPVAAVPLALVTHARLAPWPASARTLSAAPIAGVERLPHGETIALGETTVSLHSSGHSLGSAQVRIEAAGEVWVVAPAWKRAADPTCAPFEVVPCDALVIEAPFALPIYRWEAGTVAAINAWWEKNRTRASWLFCAELATAARVLAELARLGASRPALVHASLEPGLRVYREAGIPLLPTEPLGRGKLAGELVLAAADARAGVSPRGAETALASGIMRVRGNRRRASFDRGFALAEHADWSAIQETIAATGARRVFTRGAHAETLARYLREERGLDARSLAP
jgi:putative mRNA 3-end processing factor